MTATHRHCTEFARAGAGLPTIEPGMPAPAGTGLDRRQFLLRSVGLGLTVYGAGALTGARITDGIAQATAAVAPTDPVLVSVFVPGGWDALSVLAPVTDGNYRAWRPTLAQVEDPALTWSEDTRLQLHPSLTGLRTLHGEGKLTVLPGLGYASPNQSHFTSRHFYEVGELDPMGGTGWLGRYLDLHGDGTNPLQGLALSTVLNPALAARAHPVAALDRPSSYTFSAPGVRSDGQAEIFSTFAKLGMGADDDLALASARAAVRATSTLKDQVAPYSSVTSPVPYPTGSFAEKLRSLAAMVAGGLPLRCVTVNAPGGYDTHEQQAASLASGLKTTSETLLAFQRDLEARGIADRVLVLVWSEFGRRPKENGSAGTDHGSAGCGFLLGSRATGTAVGEWPGLVRLDRSGNLRSTVDFRAVYCSLLEQWFGVDATNVIPGAERFPRPVLVR